MLIRAVVPPGTSIRLRFVHINFLFLLFDLWNQSQILRSHNLSIVYSDEDNKHFNEDRAYQQIKINVIAGYSQGIIDVEADHDIEQDLVEHKHDPFDRSICKDVKLEHSNIVDR